MADLDFARIAEVAPVLLISFDGNEQVVWANQE